MQDIEEFPGTMEGPNGIHSVSSFGALGDGISDDTKAFRNALDQAGRDGGGVVFVPAGQYLIKGHLVVPECVTLTGVFHAPPSTLPKESILVNNDGVLPDNSWIKGSTLLAVEGRGDADGEPFITIKSCSTVKGLSIFYPEQDCDEPVPYPWCIRGVGNGIAILSVLIVNPWQAVDFSMGAGRHLIDGLYAQPLRTGIYIDQCAEIGRIRNVHFWPFWNIALIKKVTDKEATAFVLAGIHFEFIDSCFCMGYNVGLHFKSNHKHPFEARPWSPSVMISNSGVDNSIGAAVIIEQSCDLLGTSFTNCELFGRIIVTEENTGELTFNACHMKGRRWWPTIASIEGEGGVTFNACRFARWDFNYEGKPAIYANGYGLTVNGCDFMMVDAGGTPVELGPKAHSSVIVGNRFRTGKDVVDNSGGNSVIESNILG